MPRVCAPLFRVLTRTRRLLLCNSFHIDCLDEDREQIIQSAQWFCPVCREKKKKEEDQEVEATPTASARPAAKRLSLKRRASSASAASSPSQPNQPAAAPPAATAAAAKPAAAISRVPRKPSSETAVGQVCSVCRAHGPLISCRTCAQLYHPFCAGQDVAAAPSPDWSCSRCTNAAAEPETQPELPSPSQPATAQASDTRSILSGRSLSNSQPRLPVPKHKTKC